MGKDAHPTIPTYAADAFLAWCRDHAGRSRIVDAVAAVLLQNQRAALARGRSPFFTITNLSLRRGAKHRNASRYVMKRLIAAPGSPIRCSGYDPKTHVWACWIEFGAWVRRWGLRALKPAQKLSQAAGGPSPKPEREQGEPTAGDKLQITPIAPAQDPAAEAEARERARAARQAFFDFVHRRSPGADSPSPSIAPDPAAAAAQARLAALRKAAGVLPA